MNGARPLALITGASSGIGLELARCFAAGGYDLALVARRREPLEQVARELESHGVRADVLPEDLLDPEAPARLQAEIEQSGRALDVVVNSAGLGLVGSFHESDPERIQQLVRLNMVVLTDLCRRFLPGMVARRRGGVLNLASTAAFQPGPGMAAYYASKAYVLSLSEALHFEVRPHGVTVTALCPGPTRTPFQGTAGLHGSVMFRTMRVMEARAVARAGYAGFRRGERVVVPGAMNAILAKAARVFPSGISARLAQRLHTTPRS